MTDVYQRSEWVPQLDDPKAIGETADLVLEVAVFEQVLWLQRGHGTPNYRAERVRLELEKAASWAARILGEPVRS